MKLLTWYRRWRAKDHRRAIAEAPLQGPSRAAAQARRAAMEGGRPKGFYQRGLRGFIRRMMRLQGMPGRVVGKAWHETVKR